MYESPLYMSRVISWLKFGLYCHCNSINKQVSATLHVKMSSSHEQTAHTYFLRQNVNNDKPGVIKMFSVIKCVSNFSVSAPLELVKRFFRHTAHKSLILSANVRHL